MPGSPVAVRAGASLLGRRLPSLSDSTRRSLRSADVSTCVVPRTLGSYGDRTFAAAGPRLWNSLPVQLRNPDITYGLFRRQLKGHLSQEARTRCSVTSDMRRHRKTLTYSLTRPTLERLVRRNKASCCTNKKLYYRRRTRAALYVNQNLQLIQPTGCNTNKIIITIKIVSPAAQLYCRNKYCRNKPSSIQHNQSK